MSLGFARVGSVHANLGPPPLAKTARGGMAFSAHLGQEERRMALQTYSNCAGKKDSGNCGCLTGRLGGGKRSLKMAVKQPIVIYIYISHLSIHDLQLYIVDLMVEINGGNSVQWES